MATSSPRKRSYAEADLDILAGLEEMVHKELQSVHISPQVCSWLREYTWTTSIWVVKLRLCLGVSREEN